MSGESLHDPRISEIFYYFEQHTKFEAGRTVGRKIGVVQEIIVRKFLLQSQRIADAILFEPFLMGRSGTGHKVEFVLFQPLRIFELELFRTLILNNDMTIALTNVDPVQRIAQFTLTYRSASIRTACRLHYGPTTKRAKDLLQTLGVTLKLSALTGTSARCSILDLKQVKASVESKRVGAQRFSASESLGSGIQTIEKAKQAALVAIDADLHYNGTIKPLAAPDQRSYISTVVLGNGVHWTAKDKNILRTFVDYTYLARDTSIIRYAEYVRNLAQLQSQPFLPFFMKYFDGMTKTPPDTFAVDANDFEIICPEEETRTLVQVLDEQIQTY